MSQGLREGYERERTLTVTYVEKEGRSAIRKDILSCDFKKGAEEHGGLGKGMNHRKKKEGNVVSCM